MITPDRPPPGTASRTLALDLGAEETFEQAFTQGVLRSERLRAGLIAAMVAVGLARWLILWIFFSRHPDGQIDGQLDLRTLSLIWGVALVYALGATVMAHRAVRRDSPPPTVFRYAIALVDTSIPTLMLVFGAEASSPAYIPASPIAWAYFVVIILATLHLDFRLCVFTGGVAGAEYAWLVVDCIDLVQSGPIDPSLTSWVWQVFRVGMLISCGVLAGVISVTIRRLYTEAVRSVHERNRVVSMFGQHVSPAVVAQLLSQDVELGGELRWVCVMFLDIQGFTAFAENRRPDEVVHYLNQLFSVTIAIVNRHHGIVNKFLGDGFMAIFGAPIADNSAARNGVGAALEILDEVEALCASGEIRPTQLRIGLHAGDVVTGNVGSAERKEYTVIGDVVNLASRVEQMNKEYGTRLLATDSVVVGLDCETVTARLIGPVTVRGREQPVEVHALA